MIYKILDEAPKNDTIVKALIKCFSIVQNHNRIVCSVSGGADSDIMLDMLIRCGVKDKTDFVFYDTGLEYSATKEHLTYLENKYQISIIRIKAVKSVVESCAKHGVPFYAKFASDMIQRLQSHNFKWEDGSFEELYKKYPRCKTALEWWCNVITGNTTQYAIKRFPYLKEFMIQNPPDFLISNKCCEYAKKKAMKKYMEKSDYDLHCIGIRKAENGIRAATYKNCFTEGDKTDSFRPIFWFSDSDKEEYEQHYDIMHSKCYTEYGLTRTGCFGCPFGKQFEHELQTIKEHEPQLYVAANNIFGESYDYTRRYLKFRDEQKDNQKNKCGEK